MTAVVIILPNPAPDPLVDDDWHEQLMREEAAQLFKPVKVSSTVIFGIPGFSTDKPAGLVTGKDAVQIPDNERTQIEAALKRAGRPVTDAAVEALYRAHSRIPQRTAQN